MNMALTMYKKLPMNNTNNNSRKPKRRGTGSPFGNSRGYANRSRKNISTLDPSLLIRKATHEAEAKEYLSTRKFDDMPIGQGLKLAVKNKGYERPSEIQDKTLEHLLEGRDMLGIAQTGTGKTAAFLIPIIEQLIRNGKKDSYALVMAPTRELATQVEDEFKGMAKGLALYSNCFIGGTSLNKDLQNLKKRAHVVIGTPGRLLDLINRKALDPSKFNTLVLDEFDRMLDMGFAPDVKRITAAMVQRKQTLLFSATIDKAQQALINTLLNDPVTVKVSNGETTGDHIDQDIVRIAEGENKFTVLCDMVSDESFQKVLVFAETKRWVNTLCVKLNRAGIQADQIHGNKTQNARQNALNAFKAGKVKVLVATDVAARGLDVSDVTHVINYQVPTSFDSYIHRIGRTGRAGKTGKAFTFVV